MKRLVPWFLLKQVKGVGPRLFKRLLERFSSPERVFDAKKAELMGIEGLHERVANQILEKRGLTREAEKRIECEIKRAFDSGYKIITYSDSSYPPLLKEIPDPPSILYLLGEIPKTPKIAVVGARAATGYGMGAARDIASGLAENGMAVVSGMATGIDTAAHKGALLKGGPTIAVLGCGINLVYPPRNRKLYYQIAENGAVLSEYSLDTLPESHNFPARNRIISGMCLGTVVVEAGMKSGSLITARFALDQNRDVFAVPGSIRSYKSTGTHYLLKQGAKLVEKVSDILEEYPYLENRGKKQAKTYRQPVSPEAAEVLSRLDAYPEQIDRISRRLKMPVAKLAAILSELEVTGLIESDGDHYRKKEEID